MIRLGYMYKRVAQRPDWLKAGIIDDIFSASGCESENFARYVDYWRHNGYCLLIRPK